MNESLQANVLEGDILSTLSLLQKGKILGLGDLTVDFFVGFYDLLKVVQKYQRLGRIVGSFHATHLSLIPKKIEDTSFEDFIPISYCNVIYKIISKIIENRLNPLLKKIIFEE